MSIVKVVFFIAVGVRCSIDTLWGPVRGDKSSLTSPMTTCLQSKVTLSTADGRKPSRRKTSTASLPLEVIGVVKCMSQR